MSKNVSCCLKNAISIEKSVARLIPTRRIAGINNEKSILCIEKRSIYTVSTKNVSATLRLETRAFLLISSSKDFGHMGSETITF